MTRRHDIWHRPDTVFALDMDHRTNLQADNSYADLNIIMSSRLLCIVSCQWLILSDSCSGLEKTEQCSPAGWQGPQSRTIYGEAEELSHGARPSRGDRHFITNNIILNARYTHMMWCVMQPGLHSIQLKCTCIDKSLLVLMVYCYLSTYYVE